APTAGRRSTSGRYSSQPLSPARLSRTIVFGRLTMRRVASGLVLVFGVLTVLSLVHAQEQAEVPVVRGTFRAEAGEAPYFQFKLPTYYRDGRIVGNALASGGSGNDIRVLVLTEQQFQA